MKYNEVSETLKASECKDDKKFLPPKVIDGIKHDKIYDDQYCMKCKKFQNCSMSVSIRARKEALCRLNRMFR